MNTYLFADVKNYIPGFIDRCKIVIITIDQKGFS